MRKHKLLRGLSKQNYLVKNRIHRDLLLKDLGRITVILLSVSKNDSCSSLWRQYGGVAFLLEKKGHYNSSMTKVIGDADVWLAMGSSLTG